VLSGRNVSQGQTRGPGMAASDQVTPDGAVSSLAMVCSVPLTAAVPTAIDMSESARDVSDAIHASLPGELERAVVVVAVVTPIQDQAAVCSAPVTSRKRLLSVKHRDQRQRTSASSSRPSSLASCSQA
jgi:hypothetical protein